MKLTLNSVSGDFRVAAVPQSGPIFDAQAIEMNRRMRYNPLRAATPELLAAAHEAFETGLLRDAAKLWDAICRRDDTLSFVRPALEDAIAGKPWGVFTVEGADPVEAARHKVALEYFYGHVSAVDAFDRNIRGKRHLLLQQMGSAFATRYAVHHFVWKPQGRALLPVPEVDGKAPASVPAITAELEFVPLWFFENLTGTLRLLPLDGMGYFGEKLNWEGEWMCTNGRGAMFAAASCYIFKRLGFQDWTNFNERYASPKVVGMTNAQRDSDPGRHMLKIVGDFNGDMGIVLYDIQDTTKPPIALLGPEGTASVDVFERFIKRQDEKLTTMFRGGAQTNSTSEENEVGISAQMKETEALELAHCHNVAGAAQHFIDRAVIRFCFGEGVEPLAYFGLPDMDQENTAELRENAGFLADRGALVGREALAQRMGVELTEDPDEALLAATPVGHDNENEGKNEEEEKPKTPAANARLQRLEELVTEACEAQIAINAGGYDPNEARDENGRWTGEAVTLPDEQWPETEGEMREKAHGIMQRLQPVTNLESGMTINFSKQGRKKTLFDKRTPHEFQSIKGLRTLLQHAKLIGSVADTKGRRQVLAFTKFEAPLAIGAARYRAEAMVKTTTKGTSEVHTFYLHRLHPSA